MVNQDRVQHARRALEYKEKGNKYFQSGDYTAAEMNYSKAIDLDPQNHILYTNRAMVSLKLLQYNRVIEDAERAIKLFPKNMKAYFQLAQAQLSKDDFINALSSAQVARELCLDELYTGKKGGNSIGPITDLLLRCKKANWENSEKEREKIRCNLLHELQLGLQERKEIAIAKLVAAENENQAAIQDVEAKFDKLNQELRIIWGTVTGEKKREVPDWCIDNITLSVMLDPVVTKNGQSYDRASILEHLKRSETDPLTREPLRPQDLRPNLALREACNEFLKENGWAAEW